MYKVVYEDKEVEVVDLAAALSFANTVDSVVTIHGGGMEIVGRFGVDSIKDGICPDGIEYDWKKRR